MGRIPPELKVIIPEQRIALYPCEPRDMSRLIVVDRKTQSIVHIGYFRDLVKFLSGDVVVINDTKVIPVRVAGKKPGGGLVNLLFLTDTFDSVNHSIVALINPSRRLREGIRISLPDNKVFIIQQRHPQGGWLGKWTINSDNTNSLLEHHKPFKASDAYDELINWLNRFGHPPLPPYIKRQPEEKDRERYQTVYAQTPGSLAAPTAGLHFTPEIIAALKANNCIITRINLDIGLGTFDPIYESDVSKHKMHSETYYIPPETAEIINTALEQNRPITAIGTTVVRTLEDAALKNLPIKPGPGTADIFIFPPYNFKIINRLLTNFHRPDSTLIQLVAAFIGWDLVNNAYQTALEQGFRFYSYGDAMLII